MTDYDDYKNNLAFPPKEESTEQKLENSEKMRDYTAEYVQKLEEKLKLAEEALSLAKGFYGYCEMTNFEILQEYEKAGVSLPSFKEFQKLKSDSLAKQEGKEIAAELKEENTKLKILLKECERIMTDCLYKIYDEGGHSYPFLEEELRTSLPKVREVLKCK